VASAESAVTQTNLERREQESKCAAAPLANGKMSRPGSFKTPFWCSMKRKDKNTMFGFMLSYEKVWAEIRVSTAGDNEVFLSFLKEQGGAVVEELSLLGASVNSAPKEGKKFYCEVKFSTGRIIKLELEEDELAHFFKQLQASVKGITITQ
jgi:hypothetical protein